MLAQQVAQRAHPLPQRTPTQQPGMPQMTGMVGAAASGNLPYAQLMPYLQQHTSDPMAYRRMMEQRRPK
jgi:hypothetical protein